ncbi:unnamed protein product [Malus baccata var. baccata]
MVGDVNNGLSLSVWYDYIVEQAWNLDRWTEHLALWLLRYICLHWDEWVGLDRLMKNTDENKKHEYLNQKQGTDKNAKLIRTTHTKPKSYHNWVYHLLTFLLLLPNHEIWIYS